MPRVSFFESWFKTKFIMPDRASGSTRWAGWKIGIMRGRNIGSGREALFKSRLREHGATVVVVRPAYVLKCPAGLCSARALAAYCVDEPPVYRTLQRTFAPSLPACARAWSTTCTPMAGVFICVLLFAPGLNVRECGVCLVPRV
jgi:hypothetical protein